MHSFDLPTPLVLAVAFALCQRPVLSAARLLQAAVDTLASAAKDMLKAIGIDGHVGAVPWACGGLGLQALQNPHLGS